MDNLIQPEYESMIFRFRGYKVMIDSDLALLYGTPTKALKQQVKRNPERFPEDFMFQLTNLEKEELVTNCDRFSGLKHSSHNPLAFTEQGVAMLSSVLRSDTAIHINIRIMRAFANLRMLLKENVELKAEMVAMDQKMNQAFRFILEKLDEMHHGNSEPRKAIGFKAGD